MIDPRTGWALPKVAWDGRTYLVVWNDWVDDQRLVKGNRVTLHGEVLDGSGFLVSEATSYGVDIDSDASGRAVVSYGGNRLRWIDDPHEPLPWEPPPDSLPPTLRSSLPWPNPTAGEIQLSLPTPVENARVDIHDTAGRRVRSFRMSGETLVWDGLLGGNRRAPAGIYYLRIRLDQRILKHRVTVLR